MLVAASCSLLGACLYDIDGSRSTLSGEDDVGDVGAECIGEEPDLPYNLDMECGDTLIPLVAAFNQKSDGPLVFAPHPDAVGDCPFLVEGATLHEAAVEGCGMITTTEADAETEGNKSTGEDRIWVTWCWYVESGVECETDHMTLRYSCGDGDGDVHDSTWPAVGPSCEGPGDDPEPEPVCLNDIDCPTGEFCNEEGSCGPVVIVD